MTDDILVELFEPETDPERLDATTRALRQELLDLDVDSVVPATSGPAPDGSRGLDVAAVGGLVVHATAAGEVVARLVTLLRSWLRHSPGQARTLKVTMDGQTLELTNATEAQQQQLVDEFLRSVGAGPDAPA